MSNEAQLAFETAEVATKQANLLAGTVKALFAIAGGAALGYHGYEIVQAAQSTDLATAGKIVGGLLTAGGITGGAALGEMTAQIIREQAGRVPQQP